MIDKVAAKLTYLGWTIAESGRPMDQIAPSWFDDAAWSLSRKRLNHYMKRESVPEIVDAIESYRGFGAYPHMKSLHEPDETIALARKVQQLKPKVIVEIGTCWGGSLFVWARSNPQAELIVSLDLPGGLYGGGYYANRIKMYQHFVSDRPGTRIDLIRCDTHREESLQTIRKILNGREIDFLFIDGDHTYEGVKQDFEMYSAFVRRGGLVAFHDINTLKPDHHVHRYWKDLSSSFIHEEIVTNRRSGTYGIGLVTLPL